MLRPLGRMQLQRIVPRGKLWRGFISACEDQNARGAWDADVLVAYSLKCLVVIGRVGAIAVRAQVVGD